MRLFLYFRLSWAAPFQESRGHRQLIDARTRCMFAGRDDWAEAIRREMTSA